MISKSSKNALSVFQVSFFDICPQIVEIIYDIINYKEEAMIYYYYSKLLGSTWIASEFFRFKFWFQVVQWAKALFYFLNKKNNNI